MFEGPRVLHRVKCLKRHLHWLPHSSLWDSLKSEALCLPAMLLWPGAPGPRIWGPCPMQPLTFEAWPRPQHLPSARPATEHAACPLVLVWHTDLWSSERFFFLAAPTACGRFLGQGSNLSSSCGNAGSLTVGLLGNSLNKLNLRHNKLLEVELRMRSKQVTQTCRSSPYR